MAIRRLAEKQPECFAFTPENEAWAQRQIGKYPPGRQASAVLPLLWQAQKQHDYWLPKPAIEKVADMLGMPYIRVLEIATFYSMFNLEPVGRHFIQLCGTTPCVLRGAEDLKNVCRERIGGQHHVSADGQFSWAEVECLGACCNAPMVQINDDYFEDLTAESLGKLMDDLAAGRRVKVGSQVGRVTSEPEPGKATTLTDDTLFDGSRVGAWRHRFEEEEEREKAKAEAARQESEAEKAKESGSIPGAESQPREGAQGKTPAGAAASPGLHAVDSAAAAANEDRRDAPAAASPAASIAPTSSIPGPTPGLDTIDSAGAAASKATVRTSAAPAAGGATHRAADSPAELAKMGTANEVANRDRTPDEDRAPVPAVEPELTDARRAAEETAMAARLSALPAGATAKQRADLVGTKPAALPAPRADLPDDLKRIRGIGPVNERKLRELGTFHFDQIGAWTRAEIDWVGTYLSFPGRIDREKWVEQAKVLAAGGSPGAAE